MAKNFSEACTALEAKVRRQAARELELQAEVLAVQEARQLMADYQSISIEEVMARLDARKEYWRNQLMTEMSTGESQYTMARNLRAMLSDTVSDVNSTSGVPRVHSASPRRLRGAS